MLNLQLFVWSTLGGVLGGTMKLFLGWALRSLAYWIVSWTKPPKPDLPTVTMEFDTMAFRVRLAIASARADELDPSFGLVGRRLDYAVNGGDVVSNSVSHLSSAEVLVEGLKPTDKVEVQLFNIDKTGRASEPAELEVDIPAVTPPPPPATLPVPTVPTATIEEVPDAPATPATPPATAPATDPAAQPATPAAQPDPNASVPVQ